MPLPSANERCQYDGCMKHRKPGMRYCGSCERKVLKRMAADNYLTEVPKDVAPETDAKAIRRVIKLPTRGRRIV